MAIYTQHVDISCNIFHTLSFNINNRAPVGHLLSLKFTNSGKDTFAEVEVKDPMSPTADIKIVGPFIGNEWAGKPNDPLIISCAVPAKSAAPIRSALMSTDGGAEVEIEFEMYDYFPEGTAGKYYKSFSCDGKKIKCIITDNSRPIVQTVAMDGVGDPPLYRFYLSLTGKSDAAKQELIVATSPTDKHNCTFGTVSV